ncbi:hypothetical protein IQ31_02420 [Sphingobacterium siyangense]|uniref:Uncharacterized protein n=1 Tax=Sphingobacterium siyangense TaxID=459529 RepID=A0A562MJE3_9SPHI|nr:hypothetical protein IQ31_02420 [Sphingobacterium siyangense]
MQFSAKKSPISEISSSKIFLLNIAFILLHLRKLEPRKGTLMHFQ